MFEAIGKRHSTDKEGTPFDFKLFFVYHICMMVLFATGEHTSLDLQINVVGILAFVIFASLILHRRRNDWHWPGVGPKDILSAIGTLALGLFFLGAAASMVSPLNTRFFPWFAAGGGITLFNALSSLKLVYLSKAKFLKDCGERPPRQMTIETAPSKPSWKKRVKMVFSVYATVAWIAGVSFMGVSGWTLRNASEEPTPERTEELHDRGKPTYVTPLQKRAMSILKWAMIVGIPSAIILGIPVHFITKDDPSPDESIDDE